MSASSTDGDDGFDLSDLFAGMGAGPVEPGAGLQGAMGELFQSYTAALKAGFTEVQAMSMVNTMIRASFGG